MQAQEQIHETKEPDWHHWTLDRMEENLGLMEDHADQYLRKPYLCDCFLKHTSKLAGYSSEMLSFSKSDKEKKHFQTLQDEFSKMHSFFENNLMPEKVDMERIRDRTRLIRKAIVDIEDKSNPKLKTDNPGKHVLECHHGKCECVIREHPKEHFDPTSFRRMKDLPKPGYDTIIGCPKGQFQAGKCQAGTELHKIIAPLATCK